MTDVATVRQPDPLPSDDPPVVDLVIADLEERRLFGRAKYGTDLRAHNGRDPLVDLYQELLDAVQYARQALYEADHDEDVKHLHQENVELRECMRELYYCCLGHLYDWEKEEDILPCCTSSLNWANRLLDEKKTSP